MQGCRLGISTTVACDHMQLRDRNVEGGFIGVFEKEKFHLAFAHVKIDQSMITTDTVLRVDNRIAFAQFGKIPHHRFDITGSLLIAFASSSCAAVARIQIVFG